MNKLLIIDDDPDICLLLEKFFSKNDFLVSTAENGKKGIELLKSGNSQDVVLCDFKLPDYSGLDILQQIKIIDPETQVIIITGYSDLKIAVDTLKKGAFDYVTKPLYPDEILMTVKQALEKKKKSSKPKDQPKTSPSKGNYLHGKSHQSRLVEKHIKLIAKTDLTVVILGETGTGKEYVAREIHRNSKRRSEPFIALDCGALPGDIAGSELFGHVKGAFTGAIKNKKGCFELANGGTLFLDEIGNLSYDIQVQFLRVLQENAVKPIGGSKDIPVDVRLLVATNEDLKKSVSEGAFREDIYHRLNEFTIQLSPLRERPEDIELFARHFLNLANRQLDKRIERISSDVFQRLFNYEWHGNLRELNNVIKRAVLLSQGNEIEVSTLPAEIKGNEKMNSKELSAGSQLTLKQVSDNAERKAIMDTLKKTGYNKSKTADLLDIDRTTLYNKMKFLGIKPVSKPLP